MGVYASANPTPAEVWNTSLFLRSLSSQNVRDSAGCLRKLNAGSVLQARDFWVPHG
jgi:hypothetical protein